MLGVQEIEEGRDEVVKKYSDPTGNSLRELYRVHIAQFCTKLQRFVIFYFYVYVPACLSLHHVHDGA